MIRCLFKLMQNDLYFDIAPLRVQTDLGFKFYTQRIYRPILGNLIVIFLLYEK